MSQPQTKQHSDFVIQQYSDAYQQLYDRPPRELKPIGDDWVLVNGARMRLTELEYLTKHLQQEYSQMLSDKKGVLNRIIGWLKKR